MRGQPAIRAQQDVLSILPDTNWFPAEPYRRPASCTAQVGADPIYFSAGFHETFARIEIFTGSDLGNNRTRDDLTPSICEEALSRFSRSDDSLAGIIEQHDIDVRDFMLLSLVCDQGELSLEQLTRALGLDTESVAACIERLSNAGLLHVAVDVAALAMHSPVLATSAGQAFTRRVLDDLE